MGFQSRSRAILWPSHTTTSYSCPTLADSTSCDAGACPPPDQVLGCLVTNWQGWSECSVTCGGSIYTRSRTVTRPAINGGTACPTTFAASVCSPTECPVDCQVASWTIWGSCSYAQSPLRLLRPSKPSCNEFHSYCAILILTLIAVAIPLFSQLQLRRWLDFKVASDFSFGRRGWPKVRAHAFTFTGHVAFMRKWFRASFPICAAAQCSPRLSRARWPPAPPIVSQPAGQHGVLARRLVGVRVAAAAVQCRSQLLGPAAAQHF